MFVGELVCLLAYAVRKMFCKSKNQRGEAEEESSVNPFLFAIPAAFDLCGSTLMFVGLTMTAASIYQMMRGLIVVITATMAVIFLGKKQYTHHIVSISMIIGAVALVGYVGIKGSEGSTDVTTATKPLGIVLILLAQLFIGGQFVSEEKLLAGKSVDPLLCVGLEGFWGCCFYAILLPIFQNITCDPSNKLCHLNPISGVVTVEDSYEAWAAIKKHPELLTMSVGIVFSIAAFNATGLAITKYASSAQRSSVDTSRTLVIWATNIWVLRTERFMWGQAAGFVVLVIGTLIYNEIWIVPIEFLNYNTQVK